MSLAEASIRVPAGESASLILRPSASGARKVAKALKRGGKPKAAVGVEIRDEAGNEAETGFTVKLTGKKKKQK